MTRRVLLVDDEEQILRVLALYLESFAEVVTATTANHAVNHLAERTFDVVISDLGLPGPHDGNWVLEQARELQPDAKRVLLTGASTRLGDPSGPEQVRVLKPVEMGRLRSLVLDGR